MGLAIASAGIAALPCADFLFSATTSLLSASVSLSFAAMDLSAAFPSSATAPSARTFSARFSLSTAFRLAAVLASFSVCSTRGRPAGTSQLPVAVDLASRFSPETVTCGFVPGGASRLAILRFGFGGEVKLIMSAVTKTTAVQTKARLLSMPCHEISRQGIPSQPIDSVWEAFNVSAARPADGLSGASSGKSIRRSATASTRALRSSSNFSVGSPCRVLSRARSSSISCRAAGLVARICSTRHLLLGGQFAVEIRAEQFCFGKLVHTLFRFPRFLG